MHTRRDLLKGLALGSGGLVLSPLIALMKDQVDALRAYYRRNVSPLGMELHAAAERAAAARDEFEAALPETMVMREMDEPRTTHLLARGDFRRKGEELLPEGPDILPVIPRAGARATRHEKPAKIARRCKVASARG